MEIDFKKGAGLVPAVVQDIGTGKVLMVAYMNEEALAKTRESGRTTFFSRSKHRLWTKGESSGNFLNVKDILVDCDGDTLLIKAQPEGPACHTGADTCFAEENTGRLLFLDDLCKVIRSRRSAAASESYTASLFQSGLGRIAQKVGEEAVETVVAAFGVDAEAFQGEAADLIFHLLVLLEEKGTSLDEVVRILEKRHADQRFNTVEDA